jgi:hypothetical protein
MGRTVIQCDSSSSYSLYGHSQWISRKQVLVVDGAGELQATLAGALAALPLSRAGEEARAVDVRDSCI